MLFLINHSYIIIFKIWWQSIQNTVIEIQYGSLIYLNFVLFHSSQFKKSFFLYLRKKLWNMKQKKKKETKKRKSSIELIKKPLEEFSQHTSREQTEHKSLMSGNITYDYYRKYFIILWRHDSDSNINIEKFCFLKYHIFLRFHPNLDTDMLCNYININEKNDWEQ